MDTEEGKEEKNTVIDKMPEEKSVVISNEQVKQTVDKEQSHIVTKKPSGGGGNGVEEVWTGIELVGLSPDSGEAETLCDEKAAVVSDERPCVNLKVDEKDDISASNGTCTRDGYKSDNEKESQSESEVNDEQLRNPVVCALPKNSSVADSMSGANRYKSDDEKESQSESETDDDRLRKPSPEGYSEDNENSEDDDDNEEDDGEEINSVDEVVKERSQSFSHESSSYSDEDHSNHSHEEFSNHSDEEYDKTKPVVNMEEDDEELKSPSHVPRRTGFWDHDDRFADISIQESREPKGNRKLWDKSEVERWQHDKYLEIEQGPKQQWEIDQLLQELDEPNQRRQPGGDGRRQRNFGDFFQDSNNQGQNYSRGNNQSDGQNYGRGNNKRGGYNQHCNQQRSGYGGECGNYRNQAEEQKGDYRYRDDGENQGYNNRTDNYRDNRSRGGYDNNKMIQNHNRRGGYNKQWNYQDQADQNEKGDYRHRNDVQYDNYHNKEKVRNKNYSNQDDNSYDRQLKQDERKYDQRESEQRGDDRDRKNEKREERQVDEKDRRRRDERREDDRNINERDNRNDERRNDKRIVEERDRRADERREDKGDERRDKTLQNSEDIERFNKKNEDHKTQHQNSRRNERHDKQDEKNRDIIPKKKGGKGRGRGVTDENFKDTRRAEEFEKLNRRKRIEQLPPRLREKALEKAEKQEKDKMKERKQVQEENYEDAEEEAVSHEDGVVRDKPKRYSSQRQKTGTSMLDIPGQISSQIPEDEEGRARYHEQLGFIQQYNQQLAARQPQNQDFVSNSNIKILEQQIIHLQSQLQQQLNLRPQQQQSVPNMMPTHPNMGIQMPNMVPGVEQQPQIYSNESVYPINQTMLSSASGEGLPMLNPQINPMVLNQLMTAAGVQSQQAHEMGGGLYVPHPQSSQQPQMQQMSDVEQQQQLRRLRPAAIPIKPPPGL